MDGSSIAISNPMTPSTAAEYRLVETPMGWPAEAQSVSDSRYTK